MANNSKQWFSCFVFKQTFTRYHTNSTCSCIFQVIDIMIQIRNKLEKITHYIRYIYLLKILHLECWYHLTIIILNEDTKITYNIIKVMMFIRLIQNNLFLLKLQNYLSIIHTSYKVLDAFNNRSHIQQSKHLEIYEVNPLVLNKCLTWAYILHVNITDAWHINNIVCLMICPLNMCT